MTIISQGNNQYSCYLDCLESFFSDSGLKVTRQTIIDDFPSETHKGQANEGLFEFTELNNEKLQTKYDFVIVPRHGNFHELRVGDFIRALSMKNQNRDHIVRFVRYLDEGQIEVMDPKLGRFDRWTQNEFVAFKCILYNVSR